MIDIKKYNYYSKEILEDFFTPTHSLHYPETCKEDEDYRYYHVRYIGHASILNISKPLFERTPYGFINYTGEFFIIDLLCAEYRFIFKLNNSYILKISHNFYHDRFFNDDFRKMYYILKSGDLNNKICIVKELGEKN